MKMENNFSALSLFTMSSGLNIKLSCSAFFEIEISFIKDFTLKCGNHSRTQTDIVHHILRVNKSPLSW